MRFKTRLCVGFLLLANAGCGGGFYSAVTLEAIRQELEPGPSSAEPPKSSPAEKAPKSDRPQGTSSGGGPFIKFTPGPSKCEQMKSAMIHGSPLLQGEGVEVEIVRVYQRVIQFDCAGAVAFEKLDTVVSPRAQFQLKAPKSKKKFLKVFIVNGSSCDSRESDPMPVRDWPLLGRLNAITGNGKTEIWIKADMADAWLTFHMGEKLNTVYVRYYYDETGEDYATVEYPVFVKYSESTEKEPREVRPTKKQCRGGN